MCLNMEEFLPRFGYKWAIIFNLFHTLLCCCTLLWSPSILWIIFYLCLKNSPNESHSSLRKSVLGHCSSGMSIPVCSIQQPLLSCPMPRSGDVLPVWLEPACCCFTPDFPVFAVKSKQCPQTILSWSTFLSWVYFLRVCPYLSFFLIGRTAIPVTCLLLHICYLD